MKLQVPFYRQQTKTDCGATVLRMVLDFLGDKNHDYEDLVKLTDPDKSGVIFTLGIAKAAAELGYKSEFYTIALEPNPAVWELDYSKQFSEGFEANKKKITQLKEEIKKYGGDLQEKSISLKEIRDKLNQGTVPIILMDWSKIDTKITKPHFHFVPVVGYDNTHMYVHTQYNISTLNESILEDRPFFAIENKLFDFSRKSFGTDEDLVFISKK